MKTLFYPVLLLFLFTSCCIENKMNETAARINEIKKGQAAESIQVSSISKQGFKKLDEIKIDSFINARMQTRLQKAKNGLDSINTILIAIEEKLKSKKAFRQAYKKEILPALTRLENYRGDYSIRQKVYVMLEDGLDIANYTLFDLAAFFGPGKYKIPEQSVEVAAKSFSPLVESVIKFSNKYRELPRKATLVILGFADGTGFSPESQLYKTLADLIGKAEVTNPELNQKLSELRATELVNMLTRQFILKESSLEGKEGFKVEYLQMGKGEQLPIPGINDYRVDDERRRIVLCYWAVIPD